MRKITLEKENSLNECSQKIIVKFYSEENEATDKKDNSEQTPKVSPKTE